VFLDMIAEVVLLCKGHRARAQRAEWGDDLLDSSLGCMEMPLHFESGMTSLPSTKLDSRFPSGTAVPSLYERYLYEKSSPHPLRKGSLLPSSAAGSLIRPSLKQTDSCYTKTSSGSPVACPPRLRKLRVKEAPEGRKTPEGKEMQRIESTFHTSNDTMPTQVSTDNWLNLRREQSEFVSERPLCDRVLSRLPLETSLPSSEALSPCDRDAEASRDGSCSGSEGRGTLGRESRRREPKVSTPSLLQSMVNAGEFPGSRLSVTLPRTSNSGPCLWPLPLASKENDSNASPGVNRRTVSVQLSPQDIFGGGGPRRSVLLGSALGSRDSVPAGAGVSTGASLL